MFAHFLREKVKKRKKRPTSLGLRFDGTRYCGENSDETGVLALDLLPSELNKGLATLPPHHDCTKKDHCQIRKVARPSDKEQSCRAGRQEIASCNHDAGEAR